MPSVHFSDHFGLNLLSDGDNQPGKIKHKLAGKDGALYGQFQIAKGGLDNKS